MTWDLSARASGHGISTAARFEDMRLENFINWQIERSEPCTYSSGNVESQTLELYTIGEIAQWYFIALCEKAR